MRPVRNEDLLIVIGCDIAARPGGAPGIEELAPYIRSVHRTPDDIVVRFTSDGRETLAAFVEAERQCCADIGWTVEDGPDPVLRIKAGEAALAVIGELFE